MTPAPPAAPPLSLHQWWVMAAVAGKAARAGHLILMGIILALRGPTALAARRPVEIQISQVPEQVEEQVEERMEDRGEVPAAQGDPGDVQ